MKNILQMEGVRGGTGSIYASNAPGGIINFVNKTGSENTEGVVKVSVGDYSHYRMDYNISSSIGNDWQYNFGGFARFGDGIRSPEFKGNKGGQLKANITRLLSDGYVRFHAKYLNDKNIFYLPIPLQNPTNPEPIDGFNANYGTITSIHMNNVQLPIPNGGFLERDISDGIHSEMLSLTSEFSFGIGKKWTVTNKTRYSKADIDFNAIFSLDSPFTAAAFADSIKGLSQLQKL